ncbi:MAG: VCBS repeat-containing protein [Bryobacteraceae bacterium]|nr:VCBS repeat-containing protein [Bryobacteraceae bacterium]
MRAALPILAAAILIAGPASAPGVLPEPIPFEHRIVDAQLGGGDCKGLADIDGDGKLDVIAGSRKELAWYRYPDWTKTVIAPARQEFTTDMQTANMDGDGDPDIVAPDGERGEIAWFENPRPGGDPVTAPWKKHLVGHQGDWAHDVEVGDLDGDGRLDILTRKKETFLWLQRPGGQFAKVEIREALPDGEGSALADLNADGRLDIIQNGYWLENPGNPGGEWRKRAIAEGWPRQIGVTAADLNGDGRLDVILGPAESHGRLVWYEAPADIQTGAWREHALDGDVEYLHTFQAADVDNNGSLDIVTAEMHQSARKRVSVYFQFVQSGGGVWKKQVIAGTGSHNLRLGDIDGDGDIDILGANWGGPHAPLEVWMNKLIGPSAMAIAPGWKYVLVDNKRGKWGDFDPPQWLKYFGLAAGNVSRRGALDIASGRYFYRSPARGLTGAWQRVEFPLNVDAMLMLDVDGDGRDDVIGEALPKVYWLKPLDRNGDKWDARVIGELPATGHVNGQGYALGQLVPGGKPEIVLAAGGSVYYFEIPSKPAGGNWPKVQIARDTSEEGVAAGDIDRDGHVDVVASSADGKRVSWFKSPGDGSPGWKALEIGPVNQLADRVAMADFNADGRLDVAVAEESWPDAGPASVFWFEQPSDLSQPWTRHTVVTQYTTNAMDVADMNGDGAPDIVTGEHRGTRKVAVWENRNRGASWVERVVDTGKESHLGARAIDLDGDGKPEILSICWDTYRNLHLWTRK